MNHLKPHSEDTPHDLSRIFFVTTFHLASTLFSAEEMEVRFSSPEIGIGNPGNSFFSPENYGNGRIYFRSASNPSLTLHSQQPSAASQPSGRMPTRRSLSARHLRKKEFPWDFQKNPSSNHLRSTENGLPNFWQDSSQESTPDPSQDPLVEQEREGEGCKGWLMRRAY